jgi:hypothetical protein
MRAPPAMVQAVSQQPNHELYQHIRVVISIILGLCITKLLSGVARFIQHPKRTNVSFIHLGWVFSLLLWVIHFWWWEFRLSTLPRWTFEIYFFVFFYASLFYLLSSLLFPEYLTDYKNYEEYFLSRRKWFFGLLALTMLADVVDTELKGAAYVQSFGIEFPLRIAGYLVLCTIGIFVANRRVQLTLVAISFIYQLSYILRLYKTE